MDSDHGLNGKLGQQLQMVGSKARMKEIIDELPDEAVGVIILGDFSECVHKDEETGTEEVCGCGHANSITYKDLGDISMSQRVYLLRALENCLFNR